MEACARFLLFEFEFTVLYRGNTTKIVYLSQTLWRVIVIHGKKNCSARQYYVACHAVLQPLQPSSNTDAIYMVEWDMGMDMYWCKRMNEMS